MQDLQLTTQATTNPPGAGFQEIFDSGYSQVLLIAAARLFWRRMLRINRRVARPLSLLVASFWPVGLNLLLVALWRSVAITAADAFLWALVFSAVNAGMLASAWLAWYLAAQAGPGLDTALADNPRHPELTKRLRRRLQSRPQVYFAVPMCVLGLLFFARSAPVIRESLQVRPLSYVIVAWTSLIGANVVYWLATMAELPLRLRFLGRLNLIRYDPANSSGIAKLVSAYWFTAYAVLVGVICLEGLALLIPEREHSALLQGLSVAFPLLAVIAALCVGAQPLYSLQATVKNHRADALGLLQEKIRLSETRLSPHGMRDLYARYDLVRSAPLPISTTSTVQYSATLVATLVGFLLQRLA